MGAGEREGFGAEVRVRSDAGVKVCYPVDLGTLNRMVSTLLFSHTIS